MSYGRSLRQDFSIRARHCSQAITSAWPCLHVTGRGKGDPGSRQCKWNFSLFCPRAFLVTRSRCIRKPLYLKGPTLFFCPFSWQLFYRVSAIGKVHSHGTWLMLKIPALCTSFLALPWPLTLESSDLVPLIINGWKHGPPDLCFSDCNAHTNTWTSWKWRSWLTRSRMGPEGGISPQLPGEAVAADPSTTEQLGPSPHSYPGLSSVPPNFMSTPESVNVTWSGNRVFTDIIKLRGMY